MSSKALTKTPKLDGKPALTPKLRFPEFLGRKMHEVNLKDVTAESTVRNGLTLPSSAVMGVSKVEGIVPMQERIISSDIARYKIVQNDWFAYNPMRLNIGSIARWQGENDILVSPDYVVFKCLNEVDTGLDPVFLDHFRRSGAWEQFVQNGGDGGVRIRIYYEDIGRIELTLPTLAEQQKIADCLTSVDELIAAQSRKVDALRTHKEGLMRQLFPQPERIEDGVVIPAETQPRLRFPEFQNAGEWGTGDLGPKTDKVGSGITPNGGDKNYKQSGRPFVRSQNVGWGELLLDDVALIDEETHNSFSSTEIRLHDVLLNITGASIGRSAVADARIVGGNVNQHVCIIRVKASELNHSYLSQYLISPDGQKQIDSFQAGGNRQGLNFAQIRSFSVPLPPDVSEQQRIGDCLTSLDDLISTEAQKLDAFKTQKKGLMQQLFPSNEEVEQ